MYNRYIRNDDGVYQRVAQEQEEPPRQPHQGSSPFSLSGLLSESRGEGGIFQRLLAKLKLENIETGDVLLLLILLLLFSEGEDEELLIALGLLLLL